MTAEVSSSWSGAPPAHSSGAVRVGIAVLGAAAVVLGHVLVFDVVAAVRTVGLLVGLALVLNGCLEIAVGWRSGERARGLVLDDLLDLDRCARRGSRPGRSPGEAGDRDADGSRHPGDADGREGRHRRPRRGAWR